MQKFETRRRLQLAVCASLLLLVVASQGFSIFHASPRHSTRHVVLCALPRKARDTDNTKTSAIVKLEQEVLESTRRRLDLQSVWRIFDRTERPEEVNKSPSFLSNWNVALAAGTVAAGVSFVALHSLALSGVMMVAVFFVATRDPLEEDSVAGPLARVVGRATLESAKAAQPKVRALARAAVHGEEEWLEMQNKIKRLEQDNADLLLWKQRRIAVDERLSDFTLDELKEHARQNRLTVGGTKAQLMMRLVEANVLKL